MLFCDVKKIILISRNNKFVILWYQHKKNKCVFLPSHRTNKIHENWCPCLFQVAVTPMVFSLQKCEVPHSSRWSWCSRRSRRFNLKFMFIFLNYRILRTLIVENGITGVAAFSKTTAVLNIAFWLPPSTLEDKQDE